MTYPISRRRLLQGTMAVGALSAFGATRSGGQTLAPQDAFPSQDPARVRETVLWAHSDIDKVAQLVEGSPALANAAIDWGFGDWETAVGAASHMGRRDMADLLMKHGARPDIFTHAMLGHLAAVQAIVAAMPGVQSTYGPHGITLLSHAKAGKEEAAAVVEYLEALGDADPKQVSQPLTIPVAGYVGTYAWGSGDGQNVVVTERDGMLGLVRSKGFPRRLWHQGDHVFAPFGNGTLTVRFSVADDRAMEVSVWDPEPVMTAHRVEDTAGAG